MGSAKDIQVLPISSQDAAKVIKRIHYSGKVVNNSQLHFGVFINGRCEGAMQFGPPMVRKNLMHVVEGTKWNNFLELNRMAFGPKLPKNSESRAIGVAMRMIRKQYPHIEWVVSFADATQCGDGTIYRASGFVLTQIKKNTSIIKLPDGSIATTMTYGKGKHILKTKGKSRPPEGSEKLIGYQLRYIYFLNPSAKHRLTVPIIPFADIKKVGASMYLGKPRVESIDNDAPAFQVGPGRCDSDLNAPFTTNNNVTTQDDSANSND